MYADQVGAEGRLSVRDRLDGNSVASEPSRRRLSTGKRQREDDKWEHDLFEKNNGSQLSSLRRDGQVGARDVHLKLQRKGLQTASQGVKGSASGVRDLREKLSGVVSSPHTRTQAPKPKVVPQAPKRLRRTVTDGASKEEDKAVSNSAPRKKTTQKADIDGFLRSLDLEKYSIMFQAEEVDMTALLHMNDDDLKGLGIPMGPRKKILLAWNLETDFQSTKGLSRAPRCVHLFNGILGSRVVVLAKGARFTMCLLWKAVNLITFADSITEDVRF